jgi:hypothetical protein
VHQNADNSRERISPSARRDSDERLPKPRAPRPIRSRHRLCLVLLNLRYEPRFPDPPMFVVFFRALHGMATV